MSSLNLIAGRAYLPRLRPLLPGFVRVTCCALPPRRCSSPSFCFVGSSGRSAARIARSLELNAGPSQQRTPALWIDRDRIGVEGVSYGGQLSAWLITQTRLFKSAIPTAAIINLVSYNYTTYYNQYEQMTFGIFPHQGTLMDTLVGEIRVALCRQGRHTDTARSRRER